MIGLVRRRGIYVALAVGTIAIGLGVHRSGNALGADVRDIAGDALWAAMMMWWVSAAMPGATLRSRGLIAYGICVAVELSQLLHTPALDAIRRTTLGQLVLGSGFDVRDLGAYALGVGVAAVLERLAQR